MLASTSVPSGVDGLVSAGEVGALEGAGEVGAAVAGAAGAAARHGAVGVGEPCASLWDGGLLGGGM